MTTVSVTDLQTKQARASIYLSICQPQVLLTALVNDAGATRGQRSIPYDTGTGTGFATIGQGQTIEVDTANGTQRTLIKSISGSQSSGTIELFENGIVWGNNQVLRIKHLYEPHPIPPAIRSGVFYKFFDTPYNDNQNLTPNPVVVMGSHRAGKLVAGSIVFNITAAGSYAVASGATISSYLWTCVHNGGGTTGITIASAASATTTLTLTTADQYWLACTITDSNGKVSTSYRAVFTDPPYTDFTIQSFTGDWDSGGWRVSLQATGDVELSDFPDRSLAVLWYENTFNGVSGYVNLWAVSNEILTCGYLRQDNDSDNFDKGTGAVTFQISTIDDLLNNVAELGSVSLNATASPTKWYEYASWMTTGRSIHHLLLWHAWGVFQCADVFGLTANALGVKTTDYSEASLLQQVNGFAYDRGIFAKLICDRLGRLHLVADSQMLSDAGRAALDTVFTITEADVSGGVDVARAPEETTTFTQLDGFSFNGTTSTPFISIIPGYRENSISYIMPEERGGGTAAVSNQVLADQTDSNVRVGRFHALQNNNPRELRFSNPYNGLGAFDIIPSIGWYEWGIADVDLKRNTELFGKQFVCRHIDARFNHQAGTIFTDVVLEKEAEGPPGIQGNYPTSYPAAANNPTEPDWDDSGATDESGTDTPVLVDTELVDASAGASEVWYAGFAPGSLYVFDSYDNASDTNLYRGLVSISGGGAVTITGRAVVVDLNPFIPATYYYTDSVQAMIINGNQYVQPIASGTPVNYIYGASRYATDWLTATSVVRYQLNGEAEWTKDWGTGGVLSRDYNISTTGADVEAMVRIDDTHALALCITGGVFFATLLFTDLVDDALEVVTSANGPASDTADVSHCLKLADRKYGLLYTNAGTNYITTIEIDAGNTTITWGTSYAITHGITAAGVVSDTVMAVAYITNNGLVDQVAAAQVNISGGESAKGVVYAASSLAVLISEPLAVTYFGGFLVVSYGDENRDYKIASASI